MIELKPLGNITVACLRCASTEVTVHDVCYQGMHVLADGSCRQCTMQFWFTLPAGHTLSMPVKVAKDRSAADYPAEAAAWLALPLINSLFSHPAVEVQIEKRVLLAAHRKEAIILNTLDSCYGHVFTKLWNAQLLVKKEPQKAVIVVVPEQLAWLVPEGVAEVWTIIAPLQQLDKQLAGLDSFIKNELQRFNRVWLSSAYPHLNTAALDMEAFIKKARFDLACFSAGTPQITFCLREDRFWHASSADFLLYKAAVKFRMLPKLRYFFVQQQNRLVTKAAKLIRQQLGDVHIIITGLGKTGKFSGITDKRTDRITAEVEMQWKDIYAASNLVVGVHGSNMLLPTALAAGFIEILPRYKIPHMTEDTALPYESRYALFLGRHLDQFATPALVALHAVSMIRDFSRIWVNTEQKV